MDEELTPEQKRVLAKMRTNIDVVLAVPPTETGANKDTTTPVIIKELATSIRGIIDQIKDVKKTVPTVNPVQEGLEDAVRELSKKLVLQIMDESPELMSNLRAMLEDSLAASLLPHGEEPQAQE